MNDLVLVTGANGFIGRRLVRTLAERTVVRRCTRTATHESDVAVGDMDRHTEWASALEGVDTVVHLAGRAHVIEESAADPQAEFRRVNVEATESLASSAIKAGVTRFVFLSSIGVHGSSSERPLTEQDAPDPHNAYAVSKLEAETRLLDLTQGSEMQIVIIRPPLVYGHGAPGTFRRLQSFLRKGYPLPLGAVRNLRSYIALDNLVSLVLTCTEHPAAANQIFLASDGEDVSTPDLLRRMGRIIGKRVPLIPVPLVLLRLGAWATGNRSVVDSLCNSLQADISKSRRLLGWAPPLSLDEGLRDALGKGDGIETT